MVAVTIVDGEVVGLPPATGVPLVVPWHPLMELQVAGRDGTVLTIERNLYNYKVCEYVDEYFYERQWCYPTLVEALMAVGVYLHDGAAPEPRGWTRALDAHGGVRRRSETQPKGSEL